ncbi:MAG: glycosyltransferase [Candidatus Omnitrophica bacterium]|nr:glycosyltransferase [Candidatus Omnitrophota bacterium]
MKNNSIKISAAIPTYCRNKYLKEAVESLLSQTLPHDLYEIIVVDNSPDSSAKKFLKKIAGAKNIRYFHEPILGASNARNRALKESRGDIIAYMDDDTIAYPDWLSNIIKVFESSDLSIVCVGGKIEPIWERKRPRWLSEELEVFYSILDYSDAPMVLDEKHYLFSANMAFTKKFLSDVGGFDPSFGRTGTSLRSGEDTRIQGKIREMGLKIYYSPAIKVKHHIIKYRLNRIWFMKRMFHEGLTNANILIDEKGPLCKEARFHMLRDEIKWNLPIKLKELKKEFSPERGFRIFFVLSMLISEFGFLIRLKRSWRNEKLLYISRDILKNADIPRVTIIIPVYNAAATLRPCLDSILNQSFTDYELILVDNNSSDDSNKIINEYVLKFPRLKVFLELKKGRGAARHRGEINSSGDIILMTDTDCIVPKNWVEEIIKPITEHNEIAVQGLKKPLNPNYWTERSSKEELNLAIMRMRDGKIGFLDTANFAIKSNILKKIGYTNKDMVSGNDMELMARLLINNYKLKFSEITVLHRYDDTACKVFKKVLTRGIWRGILRNTYSDKASLFPAATKGDDYSYIISIFRELRIRHPDFKYNLITGMAWRFGQFLGCRKRARITRY